MGYVEYSRGMALGREGGMEVMEGPRTEEREGGEGGRREGGR